MMHRTRVALRWALLAAACSAALATQGAGPAPLLGVDAVLQSSALSAAQPERALLLAITRAGRRLVAVGEHGLVTLSDDDGAHWRNAAVVPVDATLTAVRFVDERTGWAVGHLGVVLRSDDGGAHWRKQLDGLQIARLAGSSDGPDKPLLDLMVDDARRLMVVGAFNLALTSDDGGERWQLASARLPNPNNLHLYGIARVGDASVAVGEQALVLAGSAGSYLPRKTPYDGSYFGVLATGATSLLVYGLRGHAYLSADGGASWTPSELPGGGASLNSALRLADGRVLLGDQAGNVFVSRDGGLRFQRVSFSWGAPLTGLAEAADGSVIASSVAGIVRISKTVLDGVSAVTGASNSTR